MILGMSARSELIKSRLEYSKKWGMQMLIDIRWESSILANRSRLIDYLMATTAEGNRDLKKFPNHPTFKTQHRWRLCHHAVYRVLKQIYKHLIVKQDKAKLIIDHYDKKFSKKVFGKGGFGVK